MLACVRNLVRRVHDSIRPERTYSDRGKTLYSFSQNSLRDAPSHGEDKIYAFLPHLSRGRQVAVSTKNQATNALSPLCKHVLKQPLSLKPSLTTRAYFFPAASVADWGRPETSPPSQR